MEHVYSLSLPDRRAVTIAPEEHLGYRWLAWREAAAACFSWSNREAILDLPRRLGR
jgi:dATP pyrophosphohydrolase